MGLVGLCLHLCLSVLHFGIDQYVYFTFSSMDLIGDDSSCSKGNKVSTIFFICKRRQSKGPVCKRGGHLNTFQCSWTRSRNSIGIHVCSSMQGKVQSLPLLSDTSTWFVVLHYACVPESECGWPFPKVADV